MEDSRNRGNKPYAELMAIFGIAWLLVLVGAIIIFKYIVPFSFCQCFYDSVAKGVFAVILSVGWLFVMVYMRNFMVNRTILRSKTSTP